MQDVLDMKVTPLSKACGALIEGIDLSQPLDERQIRFVQDAWNRHLVLVFRGQTLSEADQQRFAGYFGPAFF